MSDWRQHAACLGQPVDRFFPEDPNQYRNGVRLCEGCVVKGACLDEALQVPASIDRFGVFGGMTPPERRRLRSERAVKMPDYEPRILRWNPECRKYEEVTA